MPPKKPRPPSVGTRKGVYAHKVSKTGKIRRVYRKKNVQKLPRLKLTSNEKRRQKAALKQIAPLKRKLTQKSNLPKRSRSRTRSSSKSKSSSLLSSLSSLISN